MDETSKLNVNLVLEKKARKLTATITAESGAKVVVTADGPDQLNDALQLLFDTLCGVTDSATAMAAMEQIADEVNNHAK